MFLCENGCNFNPCRFSYKLIFIPFPFFRMKQNLKSVFQEVGDLVTKNIFLFLFKVTHALLQRQHAFVAILV